MTFQLCRSRDISTLLQHLLLAQRGHSAQYRYLSAIGGNDRFYSITSSTAKLGRQRDACFDSTKFTSTPFLTDFANRSTSQFVNLTQPFDSDLLTRDGSAVP